MASLLFRRFIMYFSGWLNAFPTHDAQFFWNQPATYGTYFAIGRRITGTIYLKFSSSFFCSWHRRLQHGCSQTGDTVTGCSIAQNFESSKINPRLPFLFQGTHLTLFKSEIMGDLVPDHQFYQLADLFGGFGFPFNRTFKDCNLVG